MEASQVRRLVLVRVRPRRQCRQFQPRPRLLWKLGPGHHLRSHGVDSSTGNGRQAAQTHHAAVNRTQFGIGASGIPGHGLKPWKFDHATGVPGLDDRVCVIEPVIAHQPGKIDLATLVAEQAGPVDLGGAVGGERRVGAAC